MIYIATISELMVRIGANSSGLRRELENSRRQMRRTFGPEAMAASSATVDTAGQLMGALSVAMGAVGIASVKMAANMETNKIAFETMLGSGEKAKALLDDLEKFGSTTPFNFDSLVVSAKKMLGLGVAAEQILPQLQVVGDAVAAVGGNAESVDSITNAFAKMQASGFISAEQMNRLTDAGIPGWQLLAKTLSDAAGKTVTVADAMKMAETKSINATTAISGMMGEMTTRYSGSMNKMSGTVVGIMSNIQDNVSSTMRKVGEDIVIAFDLKAVTSSALATLEEFSSQTRQLGIGKAMIEMVPASVEISILAVSGALIGRMVPALYETRLAIWAVTASLGPYMIAGAAITTLLGVLAYQSNKAGAETTAMNNVIYDGAGQMNVARNSANGLTAGYIDVGNAASYALQQMNIVNGMADFKRGEDTNDLPSDYWKNRNAKPVIPTPTIPDISSIGTGSEGSNGGNGGVDSAAKAYEDLQKTAKATSDSIKDEWISLTGTQIDALNNWRDKEQKDLDASASANADYALDKGRLDEIYAEKKKKILEDQQRDTNGIWDKALSDATTLQEKLNSIGLTGVDKSKFDIETDSVNQITAIQNKYRDLTMDYANGTEEQKLQMTNAWTAAGTAFEIMQDGTVSLAQQAANNIIAIEKEKNQNLIDLHYDRTKWQQEMDKAYDDGNLSDFRKLLNDKQSLIAQDLKGQQEMADVYKNIWEESHRSTTSYAAEVFEKINTGMASTFKDIIKGVDGAKSAWVGFRDTVTDIIADILSKQMAANLTSGIMGLFGGGKTKTDAFTLSNGTKLDPRFGFASGGAVFGAGNGTSDSIMAMLSNGEYVINAASVKKFGAGFFDMLNGGNMPAFATGGIVTGASLSSFGGNYDSISPGSSSNTSAPSIRVNVNNYGNANVQTEKPVFDEQSKSWILNVVVDGLKNNSSVRSAAKGAVR